MRTSLLALALVCLPSTAIAQDGLSFEHEDATGAPYFVIANVDGRLDPLPLREVAVHADISGVVADVTVTQLWENTGPLPIDATYVFPLSTRAAVHALEMRVGGRRIVATIKEREAARKTYEDARRAGQTATLLEQSRPNMFTTLVANVQPGDVIEVELAYVELLRATDGVYSLVVPKVVGPRYVSPAEAFPDVPWSVIADESRQPEPTLHAWPVSVSLRGGMAVQWAHSSTHAIDSEQRDDGLDIELAQDSPDAVDARADFVLDYALGGDALETGVLVQPAADGAGGHFLALVEAPERVDPAVVPHREYVFIVDTSGSMQGWPLALATKLVDELLTDMHAEDRVNVLCFSGGAEQLAPHSVPATTANKALARQFLGRQRGSGGTELLQALQVAFASPASQGLARTFVVVTDGYVSVEAEAFDLIRDRANDANVFAIGIGSSVNRHLLEVIARAGGGEPYIAQSETGAIAIAEDFLADVRAPILTGISFSFEGFDAYDIEPRSIPTLYASRPLLVTGRYRGKPGGALLLTGETGAGPWQSRTSIIAAEAHPAVPLLWARERIAALSDFAGARDAPENKAAVTALGLEYALVTQYTSFVAVDEARVGASDPVTGAPTEPGPAQELGLAMGSQGFAIGSGAGGGGFSGGGLGGGGSGVGRITGLGDVDVGGSKGRVGSPIESKRGAALKLTLLSLPQRRAAGGALRAVVMRRVGAFRACFEAGQTPAVGPFAWDLSLGADGTVGTVRLDRGVVEASVGQCMLRVLMRLRFPASAAPMTLQLVIDVNNGT